MDTNVLDIQIGGAAAPPSLSRRLAARPPAALLRPPRRLRVGRPFGLGGGLDLRCSLRQWACCAPTRRAGDNCGGAVPARLGNVYPRCVGANGKGRKKVALKIEYPHALPNVRIFCGKERMQYKLQSGRFLWLC